MMTDQRIEEMRLLGNNYANMKVGEVLVDIENALRSSSGGISWRRQKAERIIGKFLALSYCKGFADASEHIAPKKLIVPPKPGIIV